MILVLRPEPGAAATVARAEAMGLAAVAAPLFTIGPRAWTPPPAERFDALLLTSANAVRHAGPDLARYRALPAYAVGAATAAAARAAGLAVAHAGEGDATALLARLAADGRARPLHLAGEEVRDAAHPAIEAERIVVYAAVPVPALFPAARAALDAGAIALLHSPRAGARLAALVPNRARHRLAAISPAAAAAAGPGWCAVAVAAAPTDAALLAAAARLCEEAR